MDKKYNGKYRIPATRLRYWDYGWNSFYFVTICTQDKAYHFGEINNGTMVLSEIGAIAKKCWNEIPIHFPFVELDEFVVMPNHIHGVIIINKQTQDVETQHLASPATGTKHFTSPIIGTQNIIQANDGFTSTNKFGPQSQNLASIIRGYKIGVTKLAKVINPLWKWQPRFYDHIIRNEETYYKIKSYIMNNVENWKTDSLYEKIDD